MDTAAAASRLLPDALALGTVELAVADLDRSASFYESVVGLRTRSRERDRAELGGEGSATVIRLVEERDAKPFPANAAGLFHVAILLPTRRDLAVTFARLSRLRILSGASDHLVSEALYLDDPDGNGIEIYRDRPREEWPYEGGNLRMANEPLDQIGLMSLLEPDADLDAPAPAGTRVGHIHLQVGDLDVARAFWIEELGFDLTTTYPGALFMSAGGYHHHIAANNWRAKGRGPAPDGHAGLRAFEVLLPGANDLSALAGRLAEADVAFKRVSGGLDVTDPYGSTIRVRTA